jgi:hypothetical protein
MKVRLEPETDLLCNNKNSLIAVLSVTKFMTIISMNLVTPKVGGKARSRQTCLLNNA